MKHIFILSMFILNGLINYAQKDKSAEAYLDKVAEKSKRAKAIQVDFEYNMKDLKDESINFTQKGVLVLSGNKYQIVLDDSEIYYDGEKLYNYIPSVKEVTISKPDPEYNDLFLSNPARLFTLYEEDFKYRLLRVFQDVGTPMAEIDLIPEDRDQSYSRIRLHINTNANEIKHVKLFEKMGGRYTIKFKNYEFLSSIEDSKFSFKPSKHPDVEIIDMTGF